MRRQSGFTLIELLVVVAIIALLIAILLPSLRGAREQGRVAVCLSNLHNIGIAAYSYVTENNSIFFTRPRGYLSNRIPIGVVSEFLWGGGVPDKTEAEWDGLGVTGYNPVRGNADVYWFRPAERPLNGYITPGVSWDDPERFGANPARVLKDMDLPAVFKCPSDSSPDTPTSGGRPDTFNPENNLGNSSWEFWGTSYAINWYWAYYYRETSLGDNSSVYRRQVDLILAGNQAGLQGLGNDLLREKLAYGASDFILFMENRMNYALESARPRGATNEFGEVPRSLEGWHRQPDRHSALFLDGHALYQPFDTRYVDGPGWTTWPNKPWIEVWEQYTYN